MIMNNVYRCLLGVGQYVLAISCGPTELAKKVCPRLRDSACWCRTNFFGKLCKCSKCHSFLPAGQTFKAHRLVLAACSTHFATIFNHTPVSAPLNNQVQDLT